MTSDSRRTDAQLDEVLHRLVENMTVMVSGERLARELGVSHSKIVRLIERLRASGVEILGEPFSGYRLTRLPDVLMPSALRSRLHNGEIGRSLHHLYDVDSTNRHAKGLAAQGAAGHGAVVFAEVQLQGKGRRGRVWFSPPGAGLYVSLVLEPEIPCQLAPLLTLGSAVAVHDTIERVTGLEVDVKWPNDLLIGRRKVAGILSELDAEVDRVRSMVVGLGININQERFPPELESIATSLRIETGEPVSRSEIFVDFLATFERLYDRFVGRGPGEIIASWMEASSFASGRTIAVDDGVRRIRGVTAGLNSLGGLRIRGEDGVVDEVYSGDVVDWE